MTISKCFITKAKLSPSSKAAKHEVFLTPHNTGIYTVGTLKNFSASSTHPNIQYRGLAASAMRKIKR